MKLTDFTIEQGSHSPRKRLWKAWLCAADPLFSMTFAFSRECLYTHTAGGDHINKAGGVAFGLPKWNGSRWIHPNSFRLGWRPTKNGDAIELFQYWYCYGTREVYAITELSSPLKIDGVSPSARIPTDELMPPMAIQTLDDGAAFTECWDFSMYIRLLSITPNLCQLKKREEAYYHNFLLKVKPPCIAYPLRPYFGGEATAPHTMTIGFSINKIG